MKNIGTAVTVVPTDAAFALLLPPLIVSFFQSLCADPYHSGRGYFAVLNLVGVFGLICRLIWAKPRRRLPER